MSIAILVYYPGFVAWFKNLAGLGTVGYWGWSVKDLQGLRMRQNLAGLGTSGCGGGLLKTCEVYVMVVQRIGLVCVEMSRNHN